MLNPNACLSDRLMSMVSGFWNNKSKQARDYFWSQPAEKAVDLNMKESA